MLSFREFVSALDAEGELLRVKKAVNPRYELPALLHQAELRRKGILFEKVTGSPVPVAGSLLTYAKRFAISLGIENPAAFTRAQHAELSAQAVAHPVPMELVQDPDCQQVKHEGAGIDVQQLPVPTCFEGDSGPFLTAAVGVSRNPDNGVLNAGFYRVLVIGPDQVVVSVGPGSDLRRFLDADKAAGRNTHVALVVGGDPAFQMGAAAEVPAELSELDVAGGYTAEPLQVAKTLHADLRVPARSEIVIEVVVDHSKTVDNTMGEFGDLYGTQAGQHANVLAVTHRKDPVFHTIMAGAGREHNSLGFIVLYGLEEELREQLASRYADVRELSALFRPPEMGTTGEIYLQLAKDAKVDAATIARDVLSMKCGRYDIARVFHLVVLVDEDVDVHNKREVVWAINNRANEERRHQSVSGLDAAGGALRRVIDARIGDRDEKKLRRLVIPGLDDVRLDDYL